MTRIATAALLVSGCAGEDWGPDQLGEGRTSAPLRKAELGRQVYALYCAGCHGDTGDGNGPAARFLDPRPRDFRLGRLKFAAVSSGEAPRDEDYLRVIGHGLAGTAMPSFALLTEQERAAVVAYLKGFVADENREEPGAAPSPGKDPWASDVKGGIEEGRKTYHVVAQCWACHPAYEPVDEIKRLHTEAGAEAPNLRPNLYAGVAKESQWGAPIRAPDFLTDRIKTGLAPEDLARVVGAGVGGTAMPTWSGVLPPEQVWGIAYYVRSLALQRGTPEGKTLRQKLDAQAKEVTP